MSSKSNPPPFLSQAPFAPQMFGAAGREHMEKYKTTKQQLAKIAWKVQCQRAMRAKVWPLLL